MVLPIRQSRARRELELRYGRRVDAELVLEALNAHGTQTAAAAALGANPKTFAAWVRRLRPQRRYVLPAPTGSSAEEGRQPLTAA